MAGEVHLDPAVAGIVARGMRDRPERRRAPRHRAPRGPVRPAAHPARLVAAAAPGPASPPDRPRARGPRGVARGLSNKAIADELGITERTARTHVSNILAKLGLTSRTQAALFAVQHGLGPGR